jgi:hypothetical protein
MRRLLFQIGNCLGKCVESFTQNRIQLLTRGRQDEPLWVSFKQFHPDAPLEQADLVTHSRGCYEQLRSRTFETYEARCGFECTQCCKWR